MRYPPEHKEETRGRIVAEAARAFRSGGTAVAIGDLMRGLKLTHGGFYRHFGSKDALLSEAFAAAAEGAADRMAAVARSAPGHELEAIVRAYLSEEHCSDPSGGCPFASLAAEMARQPRALRTRLERSFRAHAEALAPYVPGRSQAERRREAMVLFSAMAGTLATARALPDPALRRTLLESARTMFLRAFTSAA